MWYFLLDTTTRSTWHVTRSLVTREAWQREWSGVRQIGRAAEDNCWQLVNHLVTRQIWIEYTDPTSERNSALPTFNIQINIFIWILLYNSDTKHRLRENTGIFNMTKYVGMQCFQTCQISNNFYVKFRECQLADGIIISFPVPSFLFSHFMPSSYQSQMIVDIIVYQ